MCDEIVKDLVNDALKGIDSDRKLKSSMMKNKAKDELLKEASKKYGVPIPLVNKAYESTRTEKDFYQEVEQLSNSKIKDTEKDKKLFPPIVWTTKEQQKRIEENEAFRLEVEAVIFVCKDLTKSVDSTAIYVNAIQHLSDIVEKYNKPEKAES